MNVLPSSLECMQQVRATTPRNTEHKAPEQNVVDVQLLGALDRQQLPKRMI
jgi:hypothetical protein